MLKKTLTLLLITLLTLGTSGCATLEILAVSGISYLVTGKSLTDNAVSMVLDQDCALHHVIQDKDICVAPDEPEGSDVSNTLLASAVSDEQTVGEEMSSEPVIAANSLVEPASEPAMASVISASNLEQDVLQPQLFAVVGSFNNYRFARNRMQKYAQFGSYIVETENPNIAYRVVVGPLQSIDELARLPTRVGVETADPWMLEMCQDGTTVTACGSSLLAKR